MRNPSALSWPSRKRSSKPDSADRLRRWPIPMDGRAVIPHGPRPSSPRPAIAWRSPPSKASTAPIPSTGTTSDGSTSGRATLRHSSAPGLRCTRRSADHSCRNPFHAGTQSQPQRSQRRSNLHLTIYLHIKNLFLSAPLRAIPLRLCVKWAYQTRMRLSDENAPIRRA